MSATRSISSARKRPLASIAMRPVVTLSRPCASARKCSVRSQIHFTGRPSRLRSFQRQRIFAVVEGLGAEAAADIAGAHADLVAADAHDLGQRRLHAVNALRADDQRPAVFIGKPLREAGARLHVVADEPVVDDGQFRHLGGLGEELVRPSCGRQARPVKARLLPIRDRPAACPGLSASPVSTAASSGSQSISTSSAASRACATLSAMMQATASPTWRTTLSHSTGMSRLTLLGAIGLRNRRLGRQRLEVRHVGGGEHEVDAGRLRGGRHVIDGEIGMGIGRADDRSA